jgi:hypothetical protein
MKPSETVTGRGDSPNIARLRRLCESDENGKADQHQSDLSHDDELLCVVDDAGPFIEAETVDAICRKIERVPFTLWHREKLVFHFEVIEPRRYAGTKLRMYVRFKPEWRRHPVPQRSKLYNCIFVALGRPTTKRDAIKYSLWLHRLFKCLIKTVTTEHGSKYSIVDNIEGRLA